MSYATPTDFINRVDVRRLGQLVNDDGTMASPSALLTSTQLQVCLDDASGLIDSAMLRGGRYQPADLTGLTGTGRAFLLRLNCDLSYGFLIERRGFTLEETKAQAPGFARALDILEQLSSGGLVFNVLANINAGRTQNVAIDANLQLISGCRRIFGDLTVNVNNPGNPTLTD